MDEVGTPDSSRIWDAAEYAAGRVVENSKEGFRKMLQEHFPEPDILLNKDRMDERYALARDNELPVAVMVRLTLIRTLTRTRTRARTRARTRT